ncbi:alpha/beta hydrolase [Streptosporangiaceae bacterium NEAU-GS5]|nr:alpha/beta hydrolase [Streptosporangiaceae bacterium NEAU-GS5]
MSTFASSTFNSHDGTVIAYERAGSGPPVVLVDGAMCFRGAGPMTPLAERLRDRFTVYTYDRRGRGGSSDTLPYAAEREVEDLRALIAEAGGEAYVYAISSGGALALRTAAAEPGITKLAIYEVPYMAEVGEETEAKEYGERLLELLAAGQRGDAVALFMSRVGIPAQIIDGMRSGPGWAGMEAIAPTLAYDDAVLDGGAIPRALAARITIPALVIAGGASPDRLQAAAQATADALPTAQFRVLDGQTHDVHPDALAPTLHEFFN